VIESLARVEISQQPSQPGTGGLVRSTPDFDLRLYGETDAANGMGSADTQARLEKGNSELRRLIDSSRRQLGNDEFLKKAPAKVIESMRVKLADYEAQLRKNEDLLLSNDGSRT
jgi:valyl-tRNA synthetase